MSADERWTKRMAHELSILSKPPTGIQAYPKSEDKMNIIEASM